MPLEYEEGFTPPPYSLELYHLKTKEFVKPLLGKKVKDIKLAEEYGLAVIIFDDDTALEISGEDCFDFDVSIIPGKEQNKCQQEQPENFSPQSV